MRAIVGFGLVLGACAGPAHPEVGSGPGPAAPALAQGVVVEAPGGLLEAESVAIVGGLSVLDLLVGEAQAQERAADDPRGGSPVDIRADDLALDGERSEAVFSGGVMLRRGTLTLTCDRLTATYGPGGQVVAARADGAVRLRKGAGLVATAPSAELDLSRGEVVLSGPARLERPEGVVEGDRIVVSLDRERVTIRGARGRFRIAAAGTTP